MDEEDKEIQAVIIRHRGQCPHYQGHAIGAVFTAIFVTAVLTFVGAAILFAFTSGHSDLRAEAIKRGYALHDPTTGQWRWR